MTHVLITNDITHPSVATIDVSCAARGWVDQERARDIIVPVVDDLGLPRLRHVGLGVALQRAMAELAHGPDRDLKTTGRKGTAKYTLICTDLERADREEHDGLGVGNAEVSARIEVDKDNPDAFKVRIFPEEHPATPLIRERFNHYCGVLSATYDLKVWVSREVFPALGAIRSPEVMGRYWLPKNDKTVTALQKLSESFLRVSELAPGFKLKLHCVGHAADDSNAVDLITDAVMDETERILSQINTELEKHNEGKKTLGKRALASQVSKAEDLRLRLRALTSSLSISLEDAETQIAEIEKHLGIAELSLE